VREELETLRQLEAAAAAALEASRKRLQEEQAALAAILQRNGATDLEGFAARLQRARAREELLGRLSALHREQQGILGDDTSATLQERLAALDAESADSAVPFGTVDATLLPSLEDLAATKDRLTAECAQIEERLAARERDGRLPAEILLELQEVDAGIDRERRFHSALRLAVDTLQEVSTTLHREVAPRLNERVGQLFAQLTRGAHLEVRLDEDLTPRVRVDADQVLGVEALSGGAADQLYFALRVTAGEILARRGESLPLLLDDPFVQYDPQRLQAGLDLVATLARSHQVLFCTCEEAQALALAERLGAHGTTCDIVRL
jgi:uncharacterized protein YhaN